MAQANTISNQDRDMTEPPAQTQPAIRKRTYQEFIKPQNVMHRFKAKSDLVQYFKESRK